MQQHRIVVIDDFPNWVAKCQQWIPNSESIGIMNVAPDQLSLNFSAEVFRKFAKVLLVECVRRSSSYRNGDEYCMISTNSYVKYIWHIVA